MVISLIISTYNRPDALSLILRALAAQSQSDFEVIIADDGSTQETSDLITTIKNLHSFPITHVWQEDQGFRLAKIRNQAVEASSGEYLIFLDGDCIPPYNYIERHRKLAEPGYFVAGNRILLSEEFTTVVLQSEVQIWNWPAWKWVIGRARRQINRLLPAIYLPLGGLRKAVKSPWRGVKGCNLAIWRKDYIAINGFDERYQGWGYEDADIAVRLDRQGVSRKEGRCATPVFHLFHEHVNPHIENRNFTMLQDLIRNTQLK